MVFFIDSSIVFVSNNSSFIAPSPNVSKQSYSNGVIGIFSKRTITFQIANTKPPADSKLFTHLKNTVKDYIKSNDWASNGSKVNYYGINFVYLIMDENLEKLKPSITSSNTLSKIDGIDPVFEDLNLKYKNYNQSESLNLFIKPAKVNIKGNKSPSKDGLEINAILNYQFKNQNEVEDLNLYDIYTKIKQDIIKGFNVRS